jgi:hypothetical protein
MTMSRPLYENQEDRNNEEAVVTEVCHVWKCSHQKLPISYKLDYALMRDQKVNALCEIKCRNVPSDFYETIMISSLKVIAARRLSEAMNVPCLFVIRYQDDIRFINFNEEPDSVEIGGRKDRNDAQDTEIVFHYDRKRLKSIYP